MTTIECIKLLNKFKVKVKENIKAGWYNSRYYGGQLNGKELYIVYVDYKEGEIEVMDCNFETYYLQLDMIEI